MQNTQLIWIPSIQKNLRFKELTNNQYRIILKNLDDDNNLDFLYNVNEIIKENLVDSFDSNKFTIFDRFVIIIFFKILNYNSLLDLTRKCDSCGEEEKIRIDLNAVLDHLGLTIDKSFKNIISINEYPIKLVCDIPTVKQEYDNLLYYANHNIEINTLDNNLEKYLFGYIRQLYVNDSLIDLDDLELAQRIQALNKLPTSLILKLKNEYVEPISNILKNVVFLQLKCKKCNSELEVKMESDNLTYLIKMFFKDNNLEGFLSEYYNISSVSYMNNLLLEKMTPKETHILLEFAKSYHKSADIPVNNTNNNEINLFENDFISK